MRETTSHLTEFNCDAEKQSSSDGASTPSCPCSLQSNDAYIPGLKNEGNICYKERMSKDYIHNKIPNVISSYMNTQNDSNTAHTYGACTLPDSIEELHNIIVECNAKIAEYTEEFFAEEEEDDINKNGEQMETDEYPSECIPIPADIRTFDLLKLATWQKNLTGELFDVIMMDPPWRIASPNPTRGVKITYDTLRDREIQSMNINCLQDEGFIFIWTVNSKLQFSISLLAEWGYRYFDQICWIKQSNNKKILKGNGFYLQHAKETCLIGIKGEPWKKACKNVKCDCLFSKRRGQSQKPNEIYDLIETLIPNGCYLEIFGRRNNLRNGWVTIGNEL